jgi:AcrR family transcriptional regulator
VRQRDATRDHDIHHAALELLAECGYDRLTIDGVAARAHAGKATIYRRWPGKADLVVDALGALDEHRLESPDTGTLRGDLLALLCDVEEMVDEQRMSLMAGLVPALRRDAELARRFDERFVGPRQGVVREVFERARARGEIADDADVELLATTLPALVTFRVLIGQHAVDAAFAERVVDHVIPPAAGTTPDLPHTP